VQQDPCSTPADPNASSAFRLLALLEECAKGSEDQGLGLAVGHGVDRPSLHLAEIRQC
jgi:hypothetical protein